MVNSIFFKIIPTYILLFFSLHSWAQNAAVKGTIKTSDGAPAEFVVVSIQGAKSAVVDAKGKYVINNVKPGTYEISATYVGLPPQTKTVSLKAGDNLVVNFTFQENSTSLDEVVVNGERNKYKVDKVSSSLRVETPIVNLPQNIQVVSASALSDQQVISMSDGLIRNVSGATRLEHWGDLYTNITMRGSQIQAFRNGINVVASYWGPLTEDASIIDHIEFVKGPAGFMLANGDPAGLYNVVTKKPTGENRGEASFTLGSFDLYRTSLDLDGKLSKDGKLLYRLNMAAQNKGSFRPNEYNNRYTFAPVLSYQIDDKTKLTAEYTLQNARMSDIGSFYMFSTEGYATLPRDFTFMPPGLPPTKINDHSAFLNLQHQLNDHWKFTAQAAYFNYQQTGTSMWPDSIGSKNAVIRGTDIWDAKSEMSFAQAFFNGEEQTGTVSHKFLGGIDLGTKNYMADWIAGHSFDLSTHPFDPFNPVNGVPENGYPAFDRSLNLEARAAAGGGLISERYTGLYIQDELGFIENKIRLTLAGRYTYVSQSAWGGDPVEADHITPRVGLSVSILPQLVVYGLYDQAFIPQSGVLTSGKKVQPITGNNIEFGIKKDWFDGKWNTTASAYRILKNNELTADPTQAPNSGLSIELGQKRAQGIEFDIKGEILRGLNVVANYAYTDAIVNKVTAGITDVLEGQKITGSNKHTINSWLSYKFTGAALNGFGLNGGFTYLIDRATGSYSASNPEQNLPDYFKLDAGVFWENKKMRVTANAFNLLDDYLYTGAYYDNYFNVPVYSWQTEPPRNYRLSITYRF